MLPGRSLADLTPPTASRPSSRDAALDAAFDAALARGTAWLVATQWPDGLWRDYPDVGGGSDGWVAAYVGTVLAGLPDPRAQWAARRAWLMLRLQDWWSAGWGYQARHPHDADSTAWALRLAARLDASRSWSAWRGHRYLARHQRADGGVATFDVPWAMRRHTGLRSRFDGWCAPHACVTAAAAGVPGFAGAAGARAWLRARQHEDGAWRAYWWHDEREYATALAAEALAGGDAPHDRAAARAAVAWALCAARADPVARSAPTTPCGSAFATALRLRVLALADGVDAPAAGGAIAAALHWLLGAQRYDGSWPPSAWLRFPPTAEPDPSRLSEWRWGELAECGVVVDARGVLTTATVVEALRALRAAGWGGRGA